MVRPNLADVDILCSVDEEAPPDDVEPNEEDYDVSADQNRINMLSYLTSGVQSGLVRRSEKLSSECGLKYQRYNTASCSDEQECSPPESINVQRCPSVANDGEGSPASVEQQWAEAEQTER